jgi:Recombinase zinc beta ribbon domain
VRGRAQGDRHRANGGSRSGAASGQRQVKDGSIAAQGVLTSIVYCAACGNKLSLTGSTNRRGERVASYFCRIHHARSGECPAPAVASTRTLDPYVERALLTALADPASKLVKAHEVGARIEQAAGHVREAEEELDMFLGGSAGIGARTRALSRRGRAPAGSGPGGANGTERGAASERSVRPWLPHARAAA